MDTWTNGRDLKIQIQNNWNWGTNSQGWERGPRTEPQPMWGACGTQTYTQDVTVRGELNKRLKCHCKVILRWAERLILFGFWYYISCDKDVWTAGGDKLHRGRAEPEGAVLSAPHITHPLCVNTAHWLHGSRSFFLKKKENKRICRFLRWVLKFKPPTWPDPDSSLILSFTVNHLIRGWNRICL